MKNQLNTVRADIIRPLLALALAFTIGCGDKSVKKEITGIYEYQNSGEDQYIVLSEKDGKMTGLYYGSAMDFDDTPEGYQPVFFVLPMNELKISGDTIKFVLNLSAEDCFAEPIDGKITSTQEAVKAGYEKTNNYTVEGTKEYIGHIQADGNIIFSEKENKLYEDRKFVYSGRTAEEISAFLDKVRQARLVRKKESLAAEEAEKAAELARKEREEALKKEAVTLVKAEREKALKEERTFTDERDGKIYRFVKIGEQVWMAENLNYFVDRSSYCYGNYQSSDKDENECLAYGRIYEDAETVKNVCPSGWHLPSADEWKSLVKFAGGEKVAGKKLKAKSGWDNDEAKSGNGTDALGFSALPGGGLFRTMSDIEFSSVGSFGYWWSATDTYALVIDPAAVVVAEDEYNKPYAYSVRCIKNEETINNEVSQ